MNKEEIMKIVVKMVDKFSPVLKKIQEKTKQFTTLQRKSASQLSQQFKKNEGRFQGWAMSIMFFGMAIQRVFLGIWKSSTTVFNDIMHSVEGTVTGFDMLQGSLKYLWYTAGAALEPIVAELIPIIDSVQNWIENNEELSRSWFKIGIKIGTILFLVGTLVLGFNGLFTAASNIITIIKAVAAGGAAMGVAIVVGIVAAITWIVLLAKKMGGLGEFLKSLLRGIIHVVVFIAEGLAWVFSKIGEGVMWTINTMIKGLNWLIEKINKIPGVNIGTIGQVDYSKYQFGDTLMAYSDWEKDSWLAPKKGYADGAGLTPQYNSDKSQVNIFKFDENALSKMINGEDVELARESMN